MVIHASIVPPPTWCNRTSLSRPESCSGFDDDSTIVSELETTHLAAARQRKRDTAVACVKGEDAAATQKSDGKSTAIEQTVVLATKIDGFGAAAIVISQETASSIKENKNAEDVTSQIHNLVAEAIINVATRPSMTTSKGSVNADVEVPRIQKEKSLRTTLIKGRSASRDKVVFVSSTKCITQKIQNKNSEDVKLTTLLEDVNNLSDLFYSAPSLGIQLAVMQG
ncbi:hypothetical protein ACH5RR_029560 [Cinchona calisaya]|uniref:Uncharacterized protein n=1 Tax=Cinchona calisaya TaxID=153742 RepID=A0ABD2YVB6_9GENT